MFLKKPDPLASGTILDARYQLVDCLGQSLFCITYKAEDLERKDFCVIRELAPILTNRKYYGTLEFPELSSDLSYRLKQHFFQEVKQLQKLNIQGIIPTRDLFEENNTAYYVRDYIEDIVSLEYLIENRVIPNNQELIQWVTTLSELLLKLHTEKIFHYNIKPSNILFQFNGNHLNKVFLIDFGATQFWFTNLTDTAHLLYDSKYTPPELANHTLFLGPATDIYSLCTSIYVLLTGPDFINEKHLDINLDSVQAEIPDIYPSLIRAMQAGLVLEYNKRPANFRDFIEILGAQFNPEGAERQLEYLDQKLLKLHHFHYKKRECPSCHGILEKVKPLRKGICPVCHEGKIQVRKLNVRLCANCKTGVLHQINNIAPLRYCPLCQTGHLNSKWWSLNFKKKSYTCDKCHENFLEQGLKITHLKSDRSFFWSEWLKKSKRSTKIWECDFCTAQFDESPDGRWKLFNPKQKQTQFYSPLYWARKAVDLPSTAGNAFCEICHADYFLSHQSLTLLHAENDFYGFAAQYKERPLNIEQIRWLAAGKHNQNEGWVCMSCKTELDKKEDKFFELIFTENSLLKPYINQTYSIGNWHRIAQDLPLIGEENLLAEEVEKMAAKAYESGELLFDPRHPNLIWESSATQYEKQNERFYEVKKGKLKITRKEICFHHFFKKEVYSLAEVANATIEDELLVLNLKNFLPSLIFEIESIPLILHIEAEDKEVYFGTAELCHHLNQILQEFETS